MESAVRRACAIGGAWLLALTASAAPVEADSITFDFTNPGAGSFGSTGNQRVFSADGISVYATAWYTTSGSSDALFAAATLGWWSTGLGVCNAGEGSCSDGNAHQVDNIAQRDYVLFLFDTSLLLETLVVDPYGTWDTDISFWFGNVGTVPGQSLAGLSYGGLGGIGFGLEQVLAGPTQSAPYTHNLNSGSEYNALLVGTLRTNQTTGFKSGDDRFKIASLTGTVLEPLTPVPEPGSLLLLGGGLAAVARRLRRAHAR